MACIIITCDLSNHVDALKCDIVNGSDHLPGWSNSKEEAIKRATYVCDVILTHESFDDNISYKIKPLKGWIERSWRGGFWYMTTEKDTGDDISYRIIVDNKGDKRPWIVRNSGKTKYGGDFLYFNSNYPADQFEAFVDTLPSSGVLYYNVLKKDTMNFKPENVEGRMKIVILNHK